MKGLHSAISEARAEYKELTFLSLVKIKRIYDQINRRAYDVDACLDDLGIHLNFELDVHVKDKIKTSITVS